MSMVAGVVMFAVAVVATPPEAVEEEPSGGCLELPISTSTSEYQPTPVVLVSVDGEMTYHGQAVPNLATLDALLADRVRDVRDGWQDVVVVHGRPGADASRVIAIGQHLEQQGYKPLFAMPRGD